MVQNSTGYKRFIAFIIKVITDYITLHNRKPVKALQNIGEEKYGRGNFFVDRFPEGAEKYLTWYCRPNMNPEMIKERSKDSS